VIELNPRNVSAYYNLGLAYYNQGQYDKAIANCNKAIHINPKFADAYNTRAAAFFFKKKYKKAWNDVHKAQHLGYKVHPEFIDALRQESGRQE
jgi:tetratricopeptide (TPR) repeat protein